MFVIELIYKASLARIDAHMPAHVAFLKKYYAAGNFLVSGRKIPREGGIILAVGKSRGEIEGIINEDPLGLDIVYLQAKRYTPGNTVGVDKVREFAGSLVERGATKGRIRLVRHGKLYATIFTSHDMPEPAIRLGGAVRKRYSHWY